MATHSNILVWRMPWTEEPGGLQPMGRKESDMSEVTKHHLVLNYFCVDKDLKVGGKNSQGNWIHFFSWAVKSI